VPVRSARAPLLGRMSNDMDDTSDLSLNAGGPVCPAVVHPAKRNGSDTRCAMVHWSLPKTML